MRGEVVSRVELRRIRTGLYSVRSVGRLLGHVIRVSRRLGWYWHLQRRRRWHDGYRTRREAVAALMEASK
jgi:hypothetical protein